MGRAETLVNTPVDIYDYWFYNHVPEKALFPYDGIPGPEGYGGPRVKREWVFLGRGLNRLLEETLTDIAKGNMVGGKGKNKEEETERTYSVPFCIVRAADGTERIMSSADADLKTVVELMELWYTADLLFINDKNYLQGILEKRAVLQGRTSRDGAAECPRASGL